MIISEFFQYLVHERQLDEQMIEEELLEIDVSSAKLKQFFLSRRYVTEEAYQQTLAKYLKFEYIAKLPEFDEAFGRKLASKIPYRLIYSNLFIPFASNDKTLEIALLDPSSIQIAEEVAAIFNRQAKFYITTESNIINAIQNIYHIEGSGEIDGDEKMDSETSHVEAEDLLVSDDEEPVRRLVNSILFQAVKTGASDIHIDGTTEQTIVRNRVDGVLQQVNLLPKHAHNRIINRVKVMSGLDISTRNVPQDGRSLIKLAGKKVDVRVSIIPTIYGERVVLRLLQQSYQMLNIVELGFLKEIEEQLLSITQSPNGIILVTGPTGSGKTTTLYACLQSIDHNERNVITIEDPVEYQISGYGQVQVNEKQGLTFAVGLRTILRQDPDVIMVGEIRDSLTAQIAIQSALTGHLVLSTLHTNDAVSTVIRLMDMEIEPFLISSTLKCVLSQRLVRRLCLSCRKKVKTPWAELAPLNPPESLKSGYSGYVYEGVGCEKCNKTGYSGRVAVHELLNIDDDIKEAIHKRATSNELRAQAQKTGALISLAKDSFLKCFAGTTSLTEIKRLLFEVKFEKALPAGDEDKQGLVINNIDT